MIDIKAVAEIAQAAAIAPHVIDHDGLGAPLLVLPGHGDTGPTYHDLSQYLANPRRVSGPPVETIEVDHFVHFVNAYKQPGYTALFASASKCMVTAVMDYHKSGAGDKPDLRFGDHVCHLMLAPDPDWTVWVSQSGKFFSQDEFAQFLDSQQWVITDPDAATVREIVLRFQATAITKFERPVYDEQSGSVKVTFTNEAEQKGSVKLPASIWLDIAPFRSAPYQQVEAKLRWRFRDSSVVFGWEIVRPDRIQESAFSAVLHAIENGTEVKPILGR